MGVDGVHYSNFLELIAADDPANVYAGELAVRPPLRVIDGGSPCPTGIPAAHFESLKGA